MNYKIVRLAGLHYKILMMKIIESVPDFNILSYKETLKVLQNNSVMYSDSFSKSFKSLGKDAYELVVDFEQLQKKWAKENNINITENWMIEILISQLE